ncbi:MAG: GAF domain-containing sensor histidine kinase [Candidatus Aminicenantes bacterium]|nr:GAF domain-containing sensor histidine kinase [Candidatus Aminicenantes bacterium]
MEKNVTYISLESSGRSFDSEVTCMLDRLRGQIGIGQTLDEVMEVVWNTTRPVLPHDRIGLSFIENDGERVTSHYFKADYDLATVRLGKDYSAGLANSTLKGILDKGAARIIGSLPAYLEENPNSVSTKLLLAEGIASNLTLPLKVDKRDVGFLFFSSRNAGVFTEVHAQVLLAVSDIISQNIEKIWRIHQLEQSRRDYLTLLGFVSHEMKSPLSSMMAVGSTYLKGYQGPVDPLADKTVKKMMRISGYMVNMVNNYLDLSRLESGEMRFNPVPGVKFREEVLDFAMDTVSARAEERGSRILVEGPEKDILLTGDLDLLRIVAVNLLDNAIKYGDENIEVQVKLAEEGGKLVFAVRNKGVGFDKEQAKKLFRRFSRLKQKGTEDRRGTGLGLYLTWWIIQKHGGRIEADSVPDQWAEFRIYLPAPQRG